MYSSLTLLFLLLANAAPSDAGLSDTLVRTVSNAHRHAIKRSSGLARDLRTALGGLRVEQQLNVQQMYCVSGSGPGLTASNGTGLSGGGGSVPRPSGTATGTASAASGSSTVAASPWKLSQNYEGNSFFNGWDFFTQADPTHGNVQYVDQQTAQSANLTSINGAGNAIMRVDTTPTVSGGNRQSVRITTQFTYTEGLVIMDSVHMPTGCGTWPAFWSNGPNWPAGGEIDIVEGVNEYTNNQATIHTNPGCTIPSSNSTALKITGNVVGGTNCAAAETGNAGCGITASGSNTYGAGFNSNGGGVYAMQWVDSGISVFFFPRNSIPSDITAGAPQPGNWGQPMAFWPSTDCNPSTFFSDHSAIFDTTLCGDWAGNVWTTTNTGGQSQSCQQITGAATCADFVANNGSAFNEAYWEVTSVKIYQQNS